MASVDRISYIIKTNEPKTNNKPLDKDDYMQIGYMAGRFGVNLSGNPKEENRILQIPQGTVVDINACTSDLFEKTLNETGIKFDRLA
jgi:hypothetical protein